MIMLKSMQNTQLNKSFKYLERAEKIMQSKNVIVNIDLDLGDGEATAWGCDLTYDYVKINAEYTT